MQNKYTVNEMKTIYNSNVTAFQPVYHEKRHRVLIHYDNGNKLILNENMEGFYELILNSTGISVLHRIGIAAHIIIDIFRDSETDIRLSPICIKPGQSFIGFKRKQGPFYICRSKIN
ncbi:hypothetical protein [Eubacterium sp. 1001713B170207_170306_E7]|uniref:hypothetical protein n=1 Tax=Eubacterium sp. 1001713B170207_170306_E7 TaxID=2787097 RepID=UPI00189BC9B8|nr:hypothetical protein [Eubacterium sp. 1001713B170207_170306_E7]